jgi:hypothetical protein
MGAEMMSCAQMKKFGLMKAVAWLPVGALLLGCPKSGGVDGDGTPVKVTVVDLDDSPIATAVVRHPDVGDRIRVNSLTGSWEGRALYMPDGSELLFEPGLTILLEVSAPGHMTQIIQYDIRKRKNNIEVVLPPLIVDDSDIEDPVINFGRDKPRDVGSAGPSN